MKLRTITKMLEAAWTVAVTRAKVAVVKAVETPPLWANLSAVEALAQDVVLTWVNEHPLVVAT